MKQQHTVKLVGITKDNEPARIGSEVDHFKAEGMLIGDITDKSCVLLRPNSEYLLVKHPTLNYYHGTCSGVKIHFMPKKIVATLIYWS